MINEKDIELIGEYEELIVLLRQLHKDTPILEKQHRSISQAFVAAQEKLESTIASSSKEINKLKIEILADFEIACRKVIDDLVSDAKSKAEATLKSIHAEKKSLEQLLSRVEVAVALLETRADEIEKTPSKRKKKELVDGEIYSGEELLEKYASHIDKDLFVKRIIAKRGQPWNHDYCMLITEIGDTRVYGEIYRDGTMIENHKGYSIYDSFMIYRGPSETEILESRE